MNTRPVRKIDGLGYGFSASEGGVTFRLIGPVDAVRLAARDLVHGLGVLWQVDSRINHVSELMKMEGRPFPEGNAQIDLVLVDLKAFDRLVTIFRYINQLGFSLPDFKSSFYLSSDIPFKIQWQYPEIHSEQGSHQQDGIRQGYATTLYSYLDMVKEFANEYTEPLLIKPYELKFNRCFWLESELQADADKRLAAKNEPLDSTRFFSGASSSSDIGSNQHTIRSIDRDMELILSDISVMEMSHPLNPMRQSTRGDAYYNITNFKHVRKNYPDYDIYTDTQKIFPHIRPEDKTRFIELVEEYVRLSEQRYQLTHPPESSIFDLSCQLL